MDEANKTEKTYSKIEKIYTAGDKEIMAYIMLPEERNKRYPVVYLIHGQGGVGNWQYTQNGNILNNVNEWTEKYNLCPMIFVMLSLPKYDVGKYDTYVYKRYGGIINKRTIDNDIKYIRRSEYGKYMLTDRAHTAIAGISMGGAAALYYAIKSREGKLKGKWDTEFGAVGAFSPSTFLWWPENKEESWIKDESDMRLDGDHYRLITCGKDEKNFDVTAEKLTNVFTKKGTSLKFYKTPDSRHSYGNFNDAFKNFLIGLSKHYNKIDGGTQL